MIQVSHFLKAAEIYFVYKTETDKASLELLSSQRNGTDFLDKKQ